MLQANYLVPHFRHLAEHGTDPLAYLIAEHFIRELEATRLRLLDHERADPTELLTSPNVIISSYHVAVFGRFPPIRDPILASLANSFNWDMSAYEWGTMRECIRVGLTELQLLEKREHEMHTFTNEGVVMLLLLMQRRKLEPVMLLSSSLTLFEGFTMLHRASEEWEERHPRHSMYQRPTLM